MMSENSADSREAGSPGSTMQAARSSTDPEARAYDLALRRARRRVRALRGWYVHATVYACVIGGLWLLYALQLTPGSGRFAWPLPATLGWGLGLGIHGLVVWLRTGIKGAQWEARKIEEYMKEELGRTSMSSR